MNIENSIKQAMSRMIERKLEINDVVVTSWEEEFTRGWNPGCNTCGYGSDEDTYEVSISYTTNGKSCYYTHEGSFAELIKELDA